MVKPVTAAYGGHGIEWLHAATPGLVSVIMPCYNAARHLCEAIESVLGQSYAAVELIIVDDGSTDDSYDLAQRYASSHPNRVRLFSQANQGPYPARNLGLANAQGEYLAFLDADDYWDRECIEKLLHAATQVDAPLAYCGWQNVGEGAPGATPYVPPDYAGDDPVRHFLRACPWPIHAAVTKRDLIDAIGGFSQRYFTSLDYDLWLRCLTISHNLARVPEVLAFYRWHGKGQISGNRSRQILDAWRVRRDFVARYPEQVAHLAPSLVRQLVNGALREAAYAAFWRRDLATAQPLFRHALLHRGLRLADLRYALPAFLPPAVFSRLVTQIDRRKDREISR